ncbi:MAG: pyrroline-5-carboxylate reductase [Candidatus Omnitrophica bacterium]|nr:pyrroline-5-carboxylate reductase [Candidatus Omnitrophota bacterium]
MQAVRLGVIGCGNMGAAITRALVEKKILQSETILINDKDMDKLRKLGESTGVSVASLDELMARSNMLLFAVKPQDFGTVAGTVKGKISGHMVLSIMAGIRMAGIKEALGGDIPVVRAMPNMAASVQESMTCLSFSGMETLPVEVKNIFGAIGEVMVLEEGLLDTVTAMSGSGPAYLFYLADAMISAGEKNGLSRERSEMLVRQTLLGAVVLLNQTTVGAAELIRAVASKGGTTEAALTIMDKAGLKDVVENAISAAKKRSEELSAG